VKKLELKTRSAHEQQYTTHYTELEEELHNTDNKKQSCKQHQYMYNRIQHTTPMQQRNYTTQKIPRHFIYNKCIMKENYMVQYQSNA